MGHDQSTRKQILLSWKTWVAYLIFKKLFFELENISKKFAQLFKILTIYLQYICHVGNGRNTIVSCTHIHRHIISAHLSQIQLRCCYLYIYKKIFLLSIWYINTYRFGMRYATNNKYLWNEMDDINVTLHATTHANDVWRFVLIHNQVSLESRYWIHRFFQGACKW